MFSVIRIDDDTVEVAQKKKVLKAKDYSSFQDAEAIILRAHIKEKEIRERSAEHYKREKRRGYQDGLAQAQQETQQKLMAAVSKYNVFISQAESQVTGLVMDLVQKIIGDMPQEKVTSGLVKNALTLMSQEKQVTVWVPSDQVKQAKTHISELLEDFPNIEFIEIKADANLNFGESRLETPIGVLDANIEQQLKLLQQHIKEEFRNLAK